MDNPVIVFILTLIGSFVVLFGIGTLSDDIEFTYVCFLILVFSFTTTILFQLLYRVNNLEKKNK